MDAAGVSFADPAEICRKRLIREEMVAVAQSVVRQEEFSRAGDLVVVVAGIPFGQSGSTNNLRILRIGA